MTRPSRSARPSPAMAAAMSGAVDLSALKQRAEAKAQAEKSGSAPATGPAGNVVTVTEANFEAEVLERSMEVPVVVALATPRSDASIALQDALERLAVADNGTWVLAKVDVDANIRIAQVFGVQAIPTVIAIAAGQPLTDFQGVQPEAQLRRWIDAILRAVEGKLPGPPQQAGAAQEQPEDPRFVAAEDAVAAGDFERAAAAYEAILAAEPGNGQARAALRQVQFYARASALAPDVVATADAAPGDIDAQFAAADAEVFAQQPEAAFDRLIGLVKRTAGEDRNRVRTRLLELFELFDPAEPIVMAARRKLATALY